MDNNAIFDKSDMGREEIVTRKYKLAPRMRSLLVLVDGKKSVADLLQQVAGLGLDQASLNELYELGFVEPATTMVTTTRSQSSATTYTDAPRNAAPLAAQEAEVAVTVRPSAPGLIGAEQLLALQTFFNTTIKNTLGLRGFTLQLKAERAMSMPDFLDLRQPYFDAVAKSKGNEMAIALRDRLDQLLQEAEKSVRAA